MFDKLRKRITAALVPELGGKRSVVRIFAATFIATFFIELLIMFFLPGLETRSMELAFIDASLLVVFLFPFFYFVVFLPMFHQTKSELNRAKLNLEEAQRIARLGYWEHDLIKNDLIWSDENCRIFGVEPGSANTYETFLETVHPDDRELVKLAHTGSVAKEMSYDIEHRLVMKDGSIKWVNERCKTEYADDGSPLRSMGTTLDITERVQAKKELEKSHGQLRALVGHIQAVREEEQKRIARDIHDDFGQLLTAINIDISWIEETLAEGQEALLERAQKASAFISTAISKVQNISSTLRPTLLDDLGITAAVESQIYEFQNRTGIKCRFVSTLGDMNVDGELATEIYRIFQEALTNVVRHAEATKVEVSLTKSDGRLILEVRDNGRGITEEEINATQSIGLIGIRERAYSLQGGVEIKGNPGKGSSIIATFPTGGK